MNYYVLFVQTQNGDTLVNLLNREEGIYSIYPKLEYYRRDIEGLALKPLFPGYVLVKCEYDSLTFRSILKKMEVKKGFIKELKYEEDVSSLSDEEIAVLKRLLNHQGILKMSYGKLVNRRIVIEQGPLVGFEPYVNKIDKHNHLLNLDLFFMDNQKWIAGITITE